MKYWILALTALLMIGCGEKESDDEFATPDFLQQKRQGKSKLFPFDINTEWVYEMHALDTSTSSMRMFKIDTFRVLGDTIVGGARWYEIDGLGRDQGYMSNLSEGLYFSPNGAEPFLLAQYPAEPGDTFTAMIGAVEAHTEVVGTNLELTVPAGTFFCHKYRQEAGPKKAVTNYYFAPGAGLIKMEILDVAGTTPVAYSVLREISHMQKQIE